MKILVIDNYDSFTFNLVQMFGHNSNNVIVKRNDEVELDFIKKIRPDKILISPGPKTPVESGISIKVIKTFGTTIPILGVCLGHQAIAYVFGCKVAQSKTPVHGNTSKILHSGDGIFNSIPQRFCAMRYHTLIVDRDSVPDSLQITAELEDGTVMGLRHKLYPLDGIQFHPESILTEYGSKIISNWIKC